MPFTGSAHPGNRTPSTPGRITWVIAGASTLFLVASVLWWMSGSSPSSAEAAPTPAADTQASVAGVTETTTASAADAAATAPSTDATAAAATGAPPVAALESPDAAGTASGDLTPATRGASVNADPVIVSAPATGTTIGDKGPDSVPEPARDPLAAAPATAPTVDLPTALGMVGTDPIAARLQLTRLVDSGTLSPEAKRQAIEAITTVNATLFFSSTVNPALRAILLSASRIPTASGRARC